MSRFVQDERGVTLTELLVGTTLFLIVMMATLLTLDGFGKLTHRNEQQNAAQDIARQAIDRLAADLRNAGGSDAALLEAASDDIVFEKVDPAPLPAGSQNASNLMRVRYCLAAGRIVRQEQTWTTAAKPGVPTTALCPDVAWGSGRAVAPAVANSSHACAPAASSAPCPLFTYDSATLGDIQAVGLHVIVDENPAARPNAVRLDTSVALRNHVDGS